MALSVPMALFKPIFDGIIGINCLKENKASEKGFEEESFFPNFAAWTPLRSSAFLNQSPRDASGGCSISALLRYNKTMSVLISIF